MSCVVSSLIWSRVSVLVLGHVSRVVVSDLGVGVVGIGSRSCRRIPYPNSHTQDGLLRRDQNRELVLRPRRLAKEEATPEFIVWCMPKVSMRGCTSARSLRRFEMMHASRDQLNVK